MSEGVPWTFAVGEEVALRSWGRVVVENVNGAQALVRYSSQSGSVWVSTSKLGPLPKPGAHPYPTSDYCAWCGRSAPTSYLCASCTAEARARGYYSEDDYSDGLD
jgi:hypothetical protein